MNEQKKNNCNEGFKCYISHIVKVVYQDGELIRTTKGVCIEIFNKSDKEYMKIQHPKKITPVTVDIKTILKVEPWDGED